MTPAHADYYIEYYYSIKLIQQHREGITGPVIPSLFFVYLFSEAPIPASSIVSLSSICFMVLTFRR
jgi:hypothetical protein